MQLLPGGCRHRRAEHHRGQHVPGEPAGRSAACVPPPSQAVSTQLELPLGRRPCTVWPLMWWAPRQPRSRRLWSARPGTTTPPPATASRCRSRTSQVRMVAVPMCLLLLESKLGRPFGGMHVCMGFEFCRTCCLAELHRCTASTERQPTDSTWCAEHYGIRVKMQKWSRNTAMGTPWLSVMWAYSASLTTFARFRASSEVGLKAEWALSCCCPSLPQ